MNSEKAVPDFSTWSFVSEAYVYYGPLKDELSEHEKLLDSEPRSFFIAHKLRYQKGSGEGTAIKIFHQETQLIFWGLKDEPRSFWALREGNRWRVFSSEKFTPLWRVLQETKDQNTKQELKSVDAILLAVLIKETNEEFMAILVKRLHAQ